MRSGQTRCDSCKFCCHAKVHIEHLRSAAGERYSIAYLVKTHNFEEKCTFWFQCGSNRVFGTSHCLRPC